MGISHEDFMAQTRAFEQLLSENNRLKQAIGCKRKFTDEVCEKNSNLNAETKQLQAENKDLMERIELAVGYLPESPDKALSFLKPEQKQ